MKEIWKSIPRYKNNYSVSTLGRVRSDKNYRKCTWIGKILNPNVGKAGYFKLSLYKNDKIKDCNIHSLVALAFIGKRPKNKQVNHKDGNKLNNKLHNLEYVTASQNSIHAFKNGLFGPCCGEDHVDSLLTEKQVLWIRGNYKRQSRGNLNQIGLARKFGVHIVTINAIINKRTWRHI